MGTWGTAISSNDTFADIYADFFDLYNEGLNIKEITEKLINKNQDIIENREDSHDFWFAIAKAQWECKDLDPMIFERVKQIIDSGANVELWNELEASGNEIKKRQKVLEKFLSDLSSAGRYDVMAATSTRGRHLVTPIIHSITNKGNSLFWHLFSARVYYSYKR